MSSIEQIKSSKVIDTEDAIYLLEQQVMKKSGNYRYKDEFTLCENFGPNGEGRCIVGKSMEDLGLSKYEVGNTSAEHTVENLRDWGWTVSIGAEIVFSAAQAMQDTGSTWNQALDAGTRVARIHDRVGARYATL